MLEYVLIAGIVIGLAAGVFGLFGTAIRGFFTRTNDQVGNAGVANP
jgi:Flp pilus assembly pilin Flp